MGGSVDGRKGVSQSVGWVGRWVVEGVCGVVGVCGAVST